MLDLVGVRVLARAGLLAPVRPDKLLSMGLAVARWGITPATGYAAGAARHPRRVALVDDEGPLTFRQVDQRTDRLATELRSRGLREGRVQAVFGPVLHNLYGSTEVACAAVATPAELAVDPRTAGRPPHGVTLRVVDERGHDVPPGTAGRIFVGSGLSFGGYTDGSDKDRLDGLVATGDLGILDQDGRLTVLGRDDDMVVIGGENVYPGQVEDVLAEDPAVDDVAVVEVEDREYGGRLVAHVVLAPGAALDEEHLADLVRRRVARFAVPREWKTLDELPRNATGKVLRKELRT